MNAPVFRSVCQHTGVILTPTGELASGLDTEVDEFEAGERR